MSTWYKVAWIPPLFAAVDKIAPGRGHAEDGTIGDLAHASGTSGHNPDDTPGVTAERQDADSKPEVRAADVDSLGTWPAGLSMEQVVQAVLHGPAAERDRLIYVIYNRRIWRKANGWRQETYTGSDPHDKHAHFSGDPASDEDGKPWTSIEKLGGGMEQKDAVQGNLARTTVGNTLADLGNARDWWYLPPGKDGNNPPPAGSRADLVLKAAQKLLAAPAVTVELTPADCDAIAAAAAELVVQKLSALRFVPDISQV